MSNESRTIRIGTRGSPLALVQARTVQAKLHEAFPDLETEIVTIKTSGDWSPSDGEVRLNTSEGGKGQFAKEIELALLDGAIDIAVHSMKDMDSNLAEGLVIDHMLEREDPCDALLLHEKVGGAEGFDAIPENAVVGTASVRRAAFLLSKRPDLKITPLRGNVQTRIDKLRAGQVGCTLLAMAGLNRLGLENEGDIVLSAEEMLPAAGQGAVGIETRTDDKDIMAKISQISYLNTVFCVKAERMALRVLDGSCHTPIGAYATLKNGEMHLRVRVVSLDGRQSFEDEIRGSVEAVENAEALGHEIGQRLKSIIPADILNANLQPHQAQEA